MNLILIGNDIDEVALDIWTANTNYYILTKSPSLKSKNFDKFIKNKPVIVVTTAKQFETKSINETVELLNKNKFIPIFIANDEKSIEVNMYAGIEEFNKNSVLYIKNEKNEGYDVLLKIARGYLLGKGIIEDDTTLQTSGTGEGTTTKE